MTPLKRYEIAASRAHRELFPPSLHRQQVYWTVVGIPAGMQKSIFDEYGNIEAFKGAPLVQPVWRDDAGQRVLRPATDIDASACAKAGCRCPPSSGRRNRACSCAAKRSRSSTAVHPSRSFAIASQTPGATRVEGHCRCSCGRCRSIRRGSTAASRRFATIAIEGEPAQTSVRVNGRVLLHSLTPVDARGAAPFGEHGEDGNHASRRRWVRCRASSTARDADGLAAALLNYRVRPRAGAHRDVVLAFPLGDERIDPAACTLAGCASRSIAHPARLDARCWRSVRRLAARSRNSGSSASVSIGLSLPDARSSTCCARRSRTC